MLKAIGMAMRYGAMIPVAVDFLKEIEDTVKDREITQEESQRLMKQFWVVVNTYRATEMGLSYDDFVEAQKENQKAKRKAKRAQIVKQALS
jgi:undecaprenyl pyrophosphate phosphatase UppP